MAQTSVPPPPPSTVSRPVSEALLNEKVSYCPSALLRLDSASHASCDSEIKEPSRTNAPDLKQWDRCLSNLLIKSSLGLGFGVVFSVLLFKRRAWPAIVGAGFGAGRAYEECNYSLKQAAREIRKQA